MQIKIAFKAIFLVDGGGRVWCRGGELREAQFKV